MLSTILALLIPAASPTSLPTLPPEITRTVSSPECNTLHKVSLPIGYVIKANDRAFRAMAISTQKFMSHFMPGDVPSMNDLEAALGMEPTSDNDALSQELGADAGDDQLLYGPGQVLDAARIDNVANQIFANLVTERKFLKDSYKEYPLGKDEKVDAMRVQAQNMIDLQQGLADRYEQFAGTYLTSQNLADIERYSLNNQETTLKTSLRGLLLGDTKDMQATDGVAAPSDGLFGFDSVYDLAKDGSNGQVVQTLRRQEYEFASTLVTTYNHCNGTNYVLTTHAKAAPAPTATP